MKNNDLEQRFHAYLSKLRNSDGDAYGPKYLSDKMSRFRRLRDKLPNRLLSAITEKTYFEVVETVIKTFDEDKARSAESQYKDYLVVIRLLYEMQNPGKIAPRYSHYGGVRVR